MSEVTVGVASLSSVARSGWRFVPGRKSRQPFGWPLPPAVVARRRVGRAMLCLGATVVLAAALAAAPFVRRFQFLVSPASVEALPMGTAVVRGRAWIDVPRPVRIWSLQAPDLVSLPLIYFARRRTDGGGREDILRFGALGLDATALRIRMYRHLADPTEAAPPFYAAMARHAAEAGLSIVRSGSPETMPTRFGTFETATLALTGLPAAPEAAVPCRGFRLILTEPGLVIGGVTCGAPGAAAPIRDRLTCIVDRLDLASGGDDRPLIDFVARTEPHRDRSCPGAALAPDGLHAAWLDDKPATHRRSVRRR